MKLTKRVRSSKIVNKLVWSLRFGVMKYPHLPQDERIVAELFPARSILDLGCARGDLLRALRAQGWSGYYEGVDFSGAAIKEARALEDANSQFWVCEMERLLLPPGKYWEAIGLIESAYYVAPSCLSQLLATLLEHVSEGGKIVIRIFNTIRAARHTAVLNTLFPNCESVAVNYESGKMFVVRGEVLAAARARLAATAR